MFAKFINQNTIEIAPKNFKGISNFDQDENLMKKNGFKEVIEINSPDGMVLPVETFEEQENVINKKYIETYVEPTLDELKEAKRSEINATRDKKEQSGFPYMGKVFDSDPISCQRISCAAQAMSLLPASDENKITWTTQDNSTIDLTAQELLGLVGALAQWSNTCHQKATALKAKIDTAQTAEELELITWDDKPVTLL